MKNHIFAYLAFFCALLIFLTVITVRNDVRFNEESQKALMKQDMCDSSLKAVTDSMIVLMKMVNQRLDTIRYYQRSVDMDRADVLNSIENAVGRIERIERQLINQNK